MSEMSTRGIVNLGSACNLRCKHCFYDTCDTRTWKPFWRNVAHVLLLRLCRMDKIDISGGEPSIYPKIEAIIRICEWLGFKEIRLVTNGVEWSKISHLCKRHKRLRLSVSFHSQNDYDLERLMGRPMLRDLNYLFVCCKNQINNVNIVPTRFNTNIEGLLLGVWILTGGRATLCIKMVDYCYSNNDAEPPLSAISKQVNESVRRLLCILKLASSQAEDFTSIEGRNFPFHFWEKDIRKNPRFKICTVITNAYDQNDWNPVMTRSATLRTYIRFILGTSSQRLNIAKKQALIESHARHRFGNTDRFSGNQWTDKCENCLDKMQCGGPMIEYVRRCGTNDIIPRLEA